MTASEWVGLIGLIVGLAGWADSLVQRFGSRTGKRFAAEQEFRMLASNQEGIRQSIEALEARIRELDREVVSLSATVRFYAPVSRRDSSPGSPS